MMFRFAFNFSLDLFCWSWLASSLADHTCAYFFSSRGSRNCAVPNECRTGSPLRSVPVREQMDHSTVAFLFFSSVTLASSRTGVFTGSISR